MSDRLLARALAPVTRRLGNMLARGVVRGVNAALKMQGLQVSLLAGEVKDGLEHCESYGLTAHPHAGAEAVVVFLGGDRSHGLVIATPDRRYRLTGLASGEVALHDDLGHIVKLGRNGMMLQGGGHTITVTDTPKVRFETPRVECTGEFYAHVS